MSLEGRICNRPAAAEVYGRNARHRCSRNLLEVIEKAWLGNLRPEQGPSLTLALMKTSHLVSVSANAMRLPSVSDEMARQAWNVCARSPFSEGSRSVKGD